MGPNRPAAKCERDHRDAEIARRTIKRSATEGGLWNLSRSATPQGNALLQAASWNPSRDGSA
jgi:hypothetical protein